MRLGRRGWRTVGGIAWLALAGCGHSVEPRGDFTDPRLIPLPENLQVFTFNEVVQLTWENEDRIFEIIDGWYIYRATGSSPSDADYIRLNDQVVTGREFVDSDVADGMIYWYRLTSVIPSGLESVPTFAVSVRVDFTPPGPPTNVSAASSPSSVLISWVAPGDSDVKDFNLFRDPLGIDFPKFNLVSTSFIDFIAEFDAGDTLLYWVTAVDLAFNESVPSDTVRVVVPAAP